MNILIGVCLFTSLLSIILMCLSLFLSWKSMMDREKMSPFECGFDPFSSSRLPFSLRFYLIALIFLIFDVEVVLIMPMIISLPFVNPTYWMMLVLFFIFILLVGLYYEWSQGALNWK